MVGGPLLSQPAVRPLTGKAANGGNGAGVAFLAEVTDDVELRRLEVRRYLEQNLIDCDAMVMVYADNAGWARAQLRAGLLEALETGLLGAAGPVGDSRRYARAATR